MFSLRFFFSVESFGAFDSADNSEGADVSESKRDDSSLTKLLVRKWEGRKEFQSPSVSGLVDPKTWSKLARNDWSFWNVRSSFVARPCEGSSIVEGRCPKSKEANSRSKASESLPLVRSNPKRSSVPSSPRRSSEHFPSNGLLSDDSFLFDLDLERPLLVVDLTLCALLRSSSRLEVSGFSSSRNSLSKKNSLQKLRNLYKTDICYVIDRISVTILAQETRIFRRLASVKDRSTLSQK